MKSVFRIVFLLSAVALFAGCQTTPKKDSEESAPKPKPFTKVDTKSSYLSVSRLPANETFVAALVDIDFSKKDISFLYSPGIIRPDGTGNVFFTPFENDERLTSFQTLADRLALRTEATPIGMLMMADGKPMTPEGEVSEAQYAFLRVFQDSLQKAGVKFVFLVPDSLRVQR